MSTVGLPLTASSHLSAYLLRPLIVCLSVQVSRRPSACILPSVCLQYAQTMLSLAVCLPIFTVSPSPPFSCLSLSVCLPLTVFLRHSGPVWLTLILSRCQSAYHCTVSRRLPAYCLLSLSVCRLLSLAVCLPAPCCLSLSVCPQHTVSRHLSVRNLLSFAVCLPAPYCLLPSVGQSHLSAYLILSLALCLLAPSVCSSIMVSCRLSACLLPTVVCLQYAHPIPSLAVRLPAPSCLSPSVCLPLLCLSVILPTPYCLSLSVCLTVP